ncbi:MAG TPA: DUF2911 domain-containing protein [Gemmatimonadales bacterium]|nr:DUF2911 domain-containing protein [Gemmatimonadales bacterium]
MLRRPLVMPVLLLISSTQAVAGQVRASELASVSQTVDGTRLTLEYSRPKARGRATAALFGGEVKWNEVWTPGANYATTLETSKDIQVNQHKVPKGKYSVWLVVKQDKPWTVVLDPRPKLFHMAHPDSAANQIRFDVPIGTGPFTETLTWAFPVVTTKGATLTMSWGDVQVPFEIEVPPTYSLTMSAEAARPYEGEYSFAWGDAPADSVPTTMTLRYEGGSLIGTFTPALWAGADRMVMIPTKTDWFLPGWIVKGELYDVERSMGMEFKRKNGKVVSYEVRDEKDALIAKGARN